LEPRSKARLLTQLGGLLVKRRLFAGALLCGLAFPFGLQQLLFQGRLARLLGLLLLGAQFFYVSAVRLALDRRADSCARRR